MEPVNYRITLKLNDTTKPSLAMRQGDTARRIYFQLAQDGKPYAITPGCYAVLSGVKPDGKTLFNNCVIDGNTIIYDTTEQTTAVKGRVKCELTLFDEQDQMVTSPGFDIVVHGKVLPGDDVASSDEAGELRKLMSDSIEFVEGCKKAATAANEAAGDARHEAESAYDAANKANKAAIDADNATQRASDATQDAEDAAGRADAVAETVQSKLDNGEFNGAQGPEGPKGDKGDKGEKGDPGEVNINDDTISDDSTWSSGQISAEISDCVGYYPQNKADSQKVQARKNIDACSFMEVVDKLCPSFTESGAVVVCEPVEGYPLTVTAEEGVTITRCGKNLFNEEAWYESHGFTQQEDGSWYCSPLNETCFTNTEKRPGSMYLTATMKTDATTTPFYLVAYYTDGTISTTLAVNKGENTFVTKTLTTDSAKTVDYIKWTYGGGGSYYLKDVMISFADSKYEPYQEGNTFPVGQQISALPGVNTLWADSGEITVTGKANPAAEIEKLKNAILAMGANV